MPKTTTAKDANRMIQEEGFQYLDVRTEEEFAQGHATNAFNIPIFCALPGGMGPNPDFLRIVESTFAKDSKLVVGCQSGGRSAQAVEVLSRAGYTNALNMDGGFHGRFIPGRGMAQPGWVTEGFETTTREGTGAFYRTLVERA